MQAVLHGVTYWRDRADEARALAQDLTSLEVKRIMLNIAESYEKLAAGAEQRIVTSTRKGDARST